MGCFNAVCNLSGLPIYHGDKIKLVVTVPGHDRHNHSLVYPSDICVPCFLPLSGKYDDYGCIEEIGDDDIGYKVLDSYFKECKVNQHLYLTDRYSKQYEDPMYSDCMWMKQIACMGVKIGRFPGDTVAKKDGGVYPSYSLILQEVWDKYLTAHDKGKAFRKRLESSMDEWFGWYGKLSAKATPNRWETSRWGKDAQYSSQERIEPLKGITLSFMSDGSRDLDSSRFTDLYFDNVLRPLFAAKAFETEKGLRLWKWFRDSFVELATISNLMHCAHLFWLPTMTAGQDRDYELHLELATIKQQIAKKRRDKNKKENGE